MQMVDDVRKCLHVLHCVNTQAFKGFKSVVWNSNRLGPTMQPLGNDLLRRLQAGDVHTTSEIMLERVVFLVSE